MLRRINPMAIICYSSPFEEMKGNVITVDYAETNNLKSYAEESQPVYNGIPKVYNGYIKWKSGYVITAGIGGGNRKNIKINWGKQEKHIVGKNNYKQQVANGKHPSILSANPEELLNKGVGKGRFITPTKESVDFGECIGKYYDMESGQYYDTTRGTVHYDSSGTIHIVPARPNNFK